MNMPTPIVNRKCYMAYRIAQFPFSDDLQ